MDWKSFFSLKGRLRRKHYVPVVLAAFVITFILGYLQEQLKVNLTAFYVLLRLALIPASVRRIHDMGYSGWFVIGVIAVPQSSLLLLFIPPDAGNEFGPDPRVKPDAEKIQPNEPLSNVKSS